MDIPQMYNTGMKLGRRGRGGGGKSQTKTQILWLFPRTTPHVSLMSSEVLSHWLLPSLSHFVQPHLR